MRKIFKPFIASCITAAFITFSLLCCCTASALVSHFQKAPACSHCHPDTPKNQAPNSSASCQHQFANAETSHGIIIAAPTSPKSFASAYNFLEKHKINIVPVLRAVFPPGGPPLGVSLAPLYLRTFNLRI